MELVTIKTFDNVVEANIIKTKLESEDIACHLYDENIIALNPLYNIMLGGVKLMVDKADTEKALEILQLIESLPITDENDKVVRCPACGSKELYTGFKSMKGLKGILSAIVSFLLYLYPIYFKTVFKCKNCGMEFGGKEG